MNAENAERNLWDQIRSVTQISMRVIQGGITILAGLLTAIAFYRKDMTEMMHYDKAKPYPFGHWIIGFLILVIVAWIFTGMSMWVRKRLSFYVEALSNLPKAYPDEPVKLYPEFPSDRSIVNYTRWIFWLFPLIDVILYMARWAEYITSTHQ